jgi:CPA1 family monovalent cation:H+ antiporter
VATAVAIAARRLRIPYTVALVLAGLVLGALHVIEPPNLTKDILFAIFLPGLLFEAAFHLDFRDFWENRGAILGLAVPGVVAAIGLTAVILTPVANTLAIERDFTWHYALVFGAVVAATDPIAVVALFKSLGAPKRLSVLVEGESLLNDGTAIVLFTLVLSLVAGRAVSGAQLVVQFVTIVGGGALIGLCVGLLISEVVRRVDDPMIEITLTTIAAYGSFVAAEQLQYSGVIATVVAGMLCGNYAARTGMSPSTRIAAETFWEYVAFALNSVVFLLIGFRVRLTALATSWQAIVVAYLAITLGRALVISVVSGLLHRTRERLPYTWAAVLTWGGLRGALSMVLALGLSPALPHRELLITMTFGVVIMSILVQGLTMAPILRWLGVVHADEDRATYDRYRGEIQAANAALAELDVMRSTRAAPVSILGTLRTEYEDRIAKIERKVEDLRIERRRLQEEESKDARRRLLLVEKNQLIDALSRGTLPREAGDRLLAEVDARLLQLESEEAEPSPEPPAGS